MSTYLLIEKNTWSDSWITIIYFSLEDPFKLIKQSSRVFYIHNFVQSSLYPYLFL